METASQAEARYHGISEAVTKVAFDPAETPIPGTSRSFTASVLLSIAFHESSFRRDVDLGIGRMRLAKSGWNDHGRSWCMMQVNLGTHQVIDTRPGHEGQWREESATQTSEGWWGTELLEDREKCFRAGLHIVQRTWGCHGGTQADALTKYASGECFTAADEAKAVQDVVEAKDAKKEALVQKILAARYASRKRVSLADRWVKTRPRLWVDTEVVKMLLAPADPATLPASLPSAGSAPPNVFLSEAQ